ncbi:MAG: DNA translocase FtsK [Chloroflexi bacterium]|nr:DNA translocase FtsK [Chloroflexota bacterium]
MAKTRSSKSTPSKSTASRARKPSKRAQAKPSARPVSSAGRALLGSLRGIPRERRLDILGIILALLGLVTFLSLVSAERSAVTSGWINALAWVFGWGIYILPLVLVIYGLWLVFRNIERLPAFSAGKFTGSLLLLFNLLAWLHLASGGGWDAARAGKGGGHLGAAFERLLVVGLGKPAAVVAMLAWLLISLALTFNLSIPELFKSLRPLFASLAESIGRFLTPPEETPAAAPHASSPPSQTPAGRFRPLRASDPAPAQQPSLESAPLASGPNPANPPAASAASEIAPAAHAALEAPVEEVRATIPQNWVLPKAEDILDPPSPEAMQETAEGERGKLIEDTLTSFGAPAHVVEIKRGPAITLYGVEPDYVETRAGRTRVRVSKIVNLADDLALALAASRIRIQAPVPGHSYVGIEVPNEETSRVSLLSILQSKAFHKIKTSLGFSLGKDVAGIPVAADLSSMPHLLIAGTTGSGKSVCVNSILCALLLNNTPLDLRLVLVDPKRVELTGYNGIPHLLAPVITDADRVVGALQWMLREMDSRYHKFSKLGVRNIIEFNARQTGEHLPYIVVIIDELADLMMLAPDETERCITRLAQLARATGIHLILATQRPSVNVVTGLIKANFPARIAFAVASGVDSRVILDQPGAERLLGRGDMLFQAPDASAPARLQGVYVSDSEIHRLVDYWRAAAYEMQTTYVSSHPDTPIDSLPPGVPLKQDALFEEMKPQEEGDPLLSEAIDLVRRQGRASITMLQRRMRIGYTRAARLIDKMEEMGVVSATLPHTQVREVLDYGDMAPPEDDGY